MGKIKGFARARLVGIPSQEAVSFLPGILVFPRVRQGLFVEIGVHLPVRLVLIHERQRILLRRIEKIDMVFISLRYVITAVEVVVPGKIPGHLEFRIHVGNNRHRRTRGFIEHLIRDDLGTYMGNVTAPGRPVIPGIVFTRHQGDFIRVICPFHRLEQRMVLLDPVPVRFKAKVCHNMVNLVLVDNAGTGPVGTQLRGHIAVNAVQVRVIALLSGPGRPVIGDLAVQAAVISGPGIHGMRGIGRLIKSEPGIGRTRPAVTDISAVFRRQYIDILIRTRHIVAHDVCIGRHIF